MSALALPPTFEARFEPFVAPVAGQACGFETLLHTGRHNKAGVLKNLKEQGWMPNLDIAMLKHARDILRAPNAPAFMTVNISLESFEKSGFVTDALIAVPEPGIRRHIYLEIPEVMPRHFEKLRIKALLLHAKGFLLAVDDWGINSPYIRHARLWPEIGMVKFDKSILLGRDFKGRDLNEASELLRLLNAELIDHQGTIKVIEGIESPSQLYMALQILGEQTLAQGYLYSRGLQREAALSFRAPGLSQLLHPRAAAAAAGPGPVL